VANTTTDDIAPPRPDEADSLRPLAERLRLSMIHLSRQLRRHDISGLTVAQVSGLASVVHHGPLGIGRLADLESLPGSAATRLADKLEAAGLIRRQANPCDRRGVQVVATDTGADLLAQHVRAGNAWLGGRLAELTDPDRTALERAVTVLESLATDSPPGTTAAQPDARGPEES